MMDAPDPSRPAVPADAWERRFQRERAARKEAERLLVEKSRELYRTNESLRAQAAELRESYVQLHHAQAALLESAKTSALGAMVASITHEVASPLGVAVTSATHADGVVADLRRRWPAGTTFSAQVDETLDDLIDAVRLVVANVRRAEAQLRATRQVAVDQVSGRLRTGALLDLLGEAVATLRPSLRRARVTLEVDGPTGLKVEVAAGALSQVVINLVQNACVHAFDDEHPDPRVWIGVEVEGTMLVVRCRDNGRGMTPAVAARAFEPFFTTRASDGGSGLGVAIAHDLVTDVFGGFLTLRTAPGQGTEWRIELPTGRERLRRV